MRIQYICGGKDITGTPYAKADADTVCIWDGELCLIEVTETGRHDLISIWEITGTDIGDMLPTEHEFETWQDAAYAMGIDYRDYR